MSLSRDESTLGDKWFLPITLLSQPFVLLMLVAPRAQITRRIVESQLFILAYAAVYAALVVRALIKNPRLFLRVMRLDAVAVAEFLGDRDIGMLPAWVHMTTSDMFIARWIYLDSMERNAPARLPILMQYLSGPLGLLGYLLTRRKTTGE